MQFSDTTNYTGIIQEIEKNTGLGLTTISSDTTKLKQFTSDVNIEQRVLWHDVFLVQGTWLFDDGQNTDLPQATTNVTSGTAKYALPSDALTVDRVALKDENGEWHTIAPYSTFNTDEAVAELNTESGRPAYYRLIGDTIELHPNPNYSSTGGLKVYFLRDTVDFASTATTATPGIATPFHYLIPLGVSIKWYKINQPSSGTLPQFLQDYIMGREAMKDFYANRFRGDAPKRITTKPHSFE